MSRTEPPETRESGDPDEPVGPEASRASPDPSPPEGSVSGETSPPAGSSASTEPPSDEGSTASADPSAGESATSDMLPAPVATSRALALPEPEIPPTTRRQDRLASQRRRRRTTIVTVLSASLLVLAVGVVVIPLLARSQGRATSAATNTATSSQPAAATAENTIFVLVTHAEDPEAPADSITLLALNPQSGRGAAVFVPVGLLLEVPGIGLDRLGAAQRYGGVSLVQESLAEALDLDIDAAVALGPDGLASLLGAGGELTVDVGDSDLVGVEDEDPAQFSAGEQTLDGEQLAEYWTLIAQGERQLAELPRQQQVMTALLEQVAENPDILDRALTVGTLDPTSTAGPEALRGVLTELAEAQEQNQLAFGVLPVRPFGGVAEDGTATYRIGDEAETMLSSLLGEDSETGETRVEVRNGVPERDLVQRVADANAVAEALGDGFRVTLGEPSDEEEVTETEIVISTDTPEMREQAETVRERLGVGTISVDEEPQTVVDMTVVLGADFPAGGGDEE
jgi:polyisoprenyl-teichoic acid--peptidoglycan teichoic acid transferase